MTRGLLFACTLLLLCGRVTAQELVPDVSRRIVELSYDFTGTDLLLFGAIAGPDEAGGQIDVVVTLEGPAETVLVRRKTRVAGIWINTESARIVKAPGFYALAATRTPETIADPSFLEQAGLGLSHLDLDISGVATATERSAFRAGFLRNMEALGLYRERADGVQIRERRLFRTEIRLPSNVPVGSFGAVIRLFVDGREVARRDLAIDVDKTGLERAIYLLARERPLLYGTAAVFIALLSGWIAGMIATRR
ncbi:MAG: TIGR02186 family protein [Rhodothalassiaceae bacterium]